MGDFSRERFSGPEPHFREHQRPKRSLAKLACEPCGSEDTEVLHDSGGGSIIGSWHEVEVRCRACGHFTAEVEEYES